MKKILFALLLLAGCNREEKPQPPTPAESARLDEAEDMLNELAANEEGPAPEDAGPSNRSE
jgi:nitrous oxide reductase accessory protein NosL